MILSTTTLITHVTLTKLRYSHLYILVPLSLFPKCVGFESQLPILSARKFFNGSQLPSGEKPKPLIHRTQALHDLAHLSHTSIVLLWVLG